MVLQWVEHSMANGNLWIASIKPDTQVTWRS